MHLSIKNLLIYRNLCLTNLCFLKCIVLVCQINVIIAIIKCDGGKYFSFLWEKTWIQTYIGGEIYIFLCEEC